MPALWGNYLVLYLGGALHILKKLPDNSVDSLVTDPPYGLSFMGKKWDYDVPSVELWREVLRVLKPGAHLLAFGGTRTYHRLVVNIEDAGFEIRDQIQWIYGQGFPKSLDVSKAIDKMHGAEREVVGQKWADRYPNGPGGNSFSVGEEPDGKRTAENTLLTAPSTEDAQKWEGWGTALKPANEPIVVARKPLSENTVAKNVLRWGTGALNIDGCRISVSENDPNHRKPSVDWQNANDPSVTNFGSGGRPIENLNTQGRFPANVIFGHHRECVQDGFTQFKRKGGGPAPRTKRKGIQGTGVVYQLEGNDYIKPSYEDSTGERVPKWNCHTECAVKMLDEQSGVSKSPLGSVKGTKSKSGIMNGTGEPRISNTGHGDSGGASRFFFTVKEESDKNSQCNPSYANIVIETLETILATLDPTARLSAAGKPEDKLVLNVKSAGSLSDSCATLIAQRLVKIKSLDFKKKESQACLDSITNYKNFILIQSLVYIAEKWASTDTIPTIQSFSKLFGCALLATDESISSESQRKNNVPTRFLYCPKASKSERNAGLEGMPKKLTGTMADINKPLSPTSVHGQTGKPNKPMEPQQNFHPTVKPVKLMEYLVKLVTPPQGTVLDPFMGSGTTGVACKNLGFNFVGIELDQEYFKIAEKRINKCPVVRLQEELSL